MPQIHVALKRGNRVRLSPEGRHLLCPRIPLDGVVLGFESNLVVVREQGGYRADYHPDFLQITNVFKKTYRR